MASKQKLSPKAAKAKAVRDKKIAMTPERKAKKAENQVKRREKLAEMVGKLGSLDKAKAWLEKRDYDHDDKRFELIKTNRGNDGKGTKSEGPNAIGNDPVKPYQAKNMADYNKRSQMYNDSLEAHISTQSFLNDVNKIKGKDTYLSDVYERHNKFMGDMSKHEKLLGTSKERIQFGGDDNWVISPNWTVPSRPKPKQQILKPASIEKMPVMQPKKIATPETRLAERPTPKYSPPTRTTAGQNNPNTSKYATVNRGDKKGYVYLDKSSYEAEMLNFKNKKK